MRKTITALAIAAVVALTAQPAHAAPRNLAPCVHEDGSGGPLPCLWDASERGNGIGRSFWIGRNGKVHYIR